MNNSLKKRSLYFLLLFSIQIAFAQAEYIEVTETAGLLFAPKAEGIAVGDFNRDGYDDFYVSYIGKKNQLYKNKGNGTFEEIAEVSGVALPDTLTSLATVWGDINNDGWLDLYVGNRNAADQLFLNLQNDQFQNITLSAGINSTGWPTAVNMADLNGDGLLDIYVSNFRDENIMYLNQGDNTFIDVNLEAGALDKGLAMGTVLFDYDKDDDIDIYLVHDGRQPNFLYQNDGTGHFTEIAKTIGVATESNGMGVDIGDINNDGWMDLHIANLGSNFLLLNNGDGTFQNISRAANITDIGMGWGTNFLDYDNDGRMDIYVANDYRFSPHRNILYQNLGSMSFERTEVIGVVSNSNASYGTAYLDYDLDGHLDLLVANQDVGIQLYKNATRSNSWIGFKLIGMENNVNSIGATIQLQDDLGRLHTREVIAGSSWQSQSTLLQHIGLGAAASIEAVTIYWPSGLVQELQIEQLNAYYTIREAGSIQEGIVLDETTSTNDPHIQLTNWTLFPNPTNGQFSITFESSTTTPLTLQVIDILGKKLVSKSITPSIGQNTLPFNLSNLQVTKASILYLQLINNEGIQSSRKLIFQQ